MKNMMNRQRLENQFDEICQYFLEQDFDKMDISIKVVYKNPQNDLEWFCIFQGSQILKGGNYKIKVVIPEAYPSIPPECYMCDGFQHYHVYQGGRVCFRLLNKDNWKMTYRIVVLLNGIIKMLVSTPEINDPASTSLTKLVFKSQNKNHTPSLKQYNEYLKMQNNKFKGKYCEEIKQNTIDPY